MHIYGKEKQTLRETNMSKSLKVGIALLIVIIAILFFVAKKTVRKKPIKVGILHSLTGTMAMQESGVVKATKLAIEQINQKGGILGRPIEAIVIDGQSDSPTFAKGAEQLITQDKVVVIFGCATSASRKTVKPIVEKYNHLLFYPFNYEGIEQSPNIVYTGAAPNQQLLPGVTWAFNNLGKTFFLVGSDYIFPHVANTILEQQINSLGGKIVGTEYLLLGSKDVKPLVQKIIAAKPEVILNTIVGDSIIAFFNELSAQGITPVKIPHMIFTVGEAELRSLKIAGLIGNYAAWNYFQSIDSKRNKKFINSFKKKYGASSTISSPMEAAYVGVHLWAQAVRQAGTTNIDSVRKKLPEQAYNAPEGVIFLDKNQNTWKYTRIGKIQANGQFNILWESDKPVEPEPYPPFYDQKYWLTLLNKLYKQWGNQWENH